MTVYEQLKKWQSIPHARREWAGYREKLTDFVVNHTEPDTSAAVLGAGHCDDLDLSRLSRHFGKIILVDREMKAMEGAEASYKRKGRLETDEADGSSENVEKVCILEKQVHDFLGITEKEYEEFSSCLQQGIELRGRNTDIRELAELAERKLEELYKKLESRPLTLISSSSDDLSSSSSDNRTSSSSDNRTSSSSDNRTSSSSDNRTSSSSDNQLSGGSDILFLGTCDYLIIAGLHSQLDNMLSWIWNAYEQALGQHAPWMYPYFAKQSDRSVHRFDEALLQTAGQGIICAYEARRLGISGKVQGAAKGIADMDTAVMDGRLERTATEKLLWNFDLAQGIAYEMLVESFKSNIYLESILLKNMSQ